MLASVLDITDRHEAQRQLRESEERFRDLFDNASDLVYVLDLGQDFVYRQHQLVQDAGLHGQKRPTQCTSLDVIAPESLPMAAELAQAQPERRKLRTWCRWCCSRATSNASRWKATSPSGAVRRQDPCRAVASSATSPPATGHMEELAEAKHKAEAADHIKSAFLASMSHELRTPLNSVIGFTGILLKRLAGPLNDEQAFQMGMVRDSARSLLALVNDVLDISRIEAGELRVAHEPFDLLAAIQKAVDTVQPLADAASLTLDMRHHRRPWAPSRVTGGAPSRCC